MVSFKLEVPITYISTCTQHRNEITTAIPMFSGSGNTERQMYKLYIIRAQFSLTFGDEKYLVIFGNMEWWLVVSTNSNPYKSPKKYTWGGLGVVIFQLYIRRRVDCAKVNRLDLRSPNRLKSAYWGRLPRLIIFEIIDEWHMSSTSNCYSGDSEEQKCSGEEIDEVQLPAKKDQHSLIVPLRVLLWAIKLSTSIKSLLDIGYSSCYSLFS